MNVTDTPRTSGKLDEILASGCNQGDTILALFFFAQELEREIGDDSK